MQRVRSTITAPFFEKIKGTTPSDRFPTVEAV